MLGMYGFADIVTDTNIRMARTIGRTLMHWFEFFIHMKMFGLGIKCGNAF